MIRCGVTTYISQRENDASPISLSKRCNVSLSKEGFGSFTSILVGLGWDPRCSDGTDLTWSVSVLILRGVENWQGCVGRGYFLSTEIGWVLAALIEHSRAKQPAPV